jgi:chloramphenicol-sensitive protein RarD
MAGHVDGRGMALAVGAYSIWGVFPAFWPLLDPAGPVEVLAHRILWTLVLMAGVLTVLRSWSELRLLSRRGWLMVAAAAALIAVNWGTCIYGVAIGRVPVVAFVMAGSFGLYALLKKTVPVPAAASLTAEGLVLGPLALGFLAWLEITGRGTLTGDGAGHVLWLVSAGLVTAVPLLLFSAAPGGYRCRCSACCSASRRPCTSATACWCSGSRCRSTGGSGSGSSGWRS